MRFVKWYTAIYAGCVAAVIALAVLLARLIGPDKLGAKILAAGIVILFAAVGGRIVNGKAMRKYQTAVPKLNDDCDAASFIEATGTSFDRACGLKKILLPSDVFGAVILLDRSVALMWQGDDLDRAIEIDNKVKDIFVRSSSDVNFKYRAILAGAYDDLAQIYCMRNADGDIEKARECVEGISRLGDVSLQSKVIYTTHRINVAEGKDLDAAWAYFSDLLEKTKVKRAQLILHSLLAEIYEKQDIPDKAAEEYEIIAREAPESRLGKTAKKRLEEFAANSN